MKSIRQILWGTLVVTVMALLVSGCAPGATRSSAPATISTTPTGTPLGSPCPCPTGSICDCAGPPPIVLKDTSPGQMALSLSLQIGDYDPATRDTIELGVGFSHQGRVVQLVAGERISCNGLVIPSYGTNFGVKLPAEVLSGKLVTCTYTSGNTSATFTFTAPLAPAILSPQEGTLVPRSKHTLVSYRISQAWAFYVIALGPSSKAWTPNAAAQPNPVTLDTSAFPPGPGSIALNQFFTLSDLRGPAFASVEGRGEAVYSILVNWV